MSIVLYIYFVKYIVNKLEVAESSTNLFFYIRIKIALDDFFWEL